MAIFSSKSWSVSRGLSGPGAILPISLFVFSLLSSLKPVVWSRSNFVDLKFSDLQRDLSKKTRQHYWGPENCLYFGYEFPSVRSRQRYSDQAQERGNSMQPPILIHAFEGDVIKTGFTERYWDFFFLCCAGMKSAVTHETQWRVQSMKFLPSVKSTRKRLMQNAEWML